MTGRVTFGLVKLRIQLMEIILIKREQLWTGQSLAVENQTVARYEILDGTPFEGEVIPIRFHLSSTDLTPTYHNIYNRFNCKYLLSLVIDDGSRRYNKQVEVELWRSKV